MLQIRRQKSSQADGLNYYAQQKGHPTDESARMKRASLGVHSLVGLVWTAGRASWKAVCWSFTTTARDSDRRSRERRKCQLDYIGRRFGSLSVLCQASPLFMPAARYYERNDLYFAYMTPLSMFFLSVAFLLLSLPSFVTATPVQADADLSRSVFAKRDGSGGSNGSMSPKIWVRCSSSSCFLAAL